MNLLSQILPQKFSKILAQGGSLSRNKFHLPPSQLISRRSFSQVVAKKPLDRTMIPMACIQMMVHDDKKLNLENARRLVEKAKQGGAKLVVLPECFNCPYSTESFRPYAEEIANADECPTLQMLQDVANQCSIYLIGGSFPEVETSGLVKRYYNTSLVFGPHGDIIAKHRKIHLFDVRIPGMNFHESKYLSPGNEVTTFETVFCKIGLGICYDMRFPEVAQICWQHGCKLMIYPGAFNMTTGPAHWELLLRSRAVDNQFFVAGISPARNPNSEYQAWGHSTVVNPWGDVIATTDHDEAIIYANIDLKKLDEVRAQIPLTKQKRRDIYELRQNFVFT